MFEVAALITQGRPEGSSEVILYSIHVQVFQYFNIGYVAALVVVYLAVTVLVALIQARYAEKRTHYR